MPNKDPTFIQMIYTAIIGNNIIQGAIMSSVIAILRILYDEKKTRPTRIILEALICGTLALCVTGIIEFLDLPDSAAITLGGAIGFIGTTALRDLILKSINRKADQ